MKKNMSAKMIKKAIDSYPGGICFSALDGRVILVNEKMNKLALELTGHTILNAKAAWDKQGWMDHPAVCNQELQR